MPASSLRSLARSFRRPLSSSLSAPAATACPALVRPRFASPVRTAALPLSARRWNSSVPTPPPALAAPEGPQSAAAEGGEASEGIKATWVPAEGQPAGPLRLPKDDPKLALTFTCTAEIVATETTVEVAEGDVRTCSHRSSHTISKQAYTSGIVLIQCPECENRHLIADHLGWFPEITQGSGEKRVLRTIEDIMQEKGETVRRGIQHGEGGNIEVF